MRLSAYSFRALFPDSPLSASRIYQKKADQSAAEQSKRKLVKKWPVCGFTAPPVRPGSWHFPSSIINSTVAHPVCVFMCVVSPPSFLSFCEHTP